MYHVRFRDPSGSVRQGEWHEETVSFAEQEYELEEVEILPPVEPSKFVCVAKNYVAHAEEFEMDVPDEPSLFLKPPNALAGHGDTIRLPAGKDRLDYEAELGVVIGRQCRFVSESDAMDAIAGFTCGNDLSNRDDQQNEDNWVRGKAFDNAAPIGPVVADPEHVPDDATVELRLNGEVRQEGHLGQLVFSIPELIAEITAYMTLEAGDVILTGTPSGVGPLSDGDEVEVSVEGIPSLVHSVAIPE